VADLVGKKLKDFYVLRRLGRGAMAEVYLAQQVSLGRQVALKVLNAELALDPNYVRRFHHEARAAAALVHGGIVQIYEVGHDEGIHYIAQEYVHGRNLGEVIRSHGSLQPRLTLDILRQVAAALSKAASEGIVHRDIKPENIMLARSGEVKVADFGLARAQRDGAATNLTQVGVTMGTPLYMSPEQIEGRPLDSRSDIYSLGVTAYHMLAGAPPFTGDTPLAVAVQHLNQPAEPLARRCPSAPTRFAAIIDRTLAKKPEARYENPAALLVELNTLAEEGAKEGWTTRSNEGLLAETIQVADDRAVATAHLDDLMKTSSITRPRRARFGPLAALLLVCALVGAALAAWLRPPSLLAGAQTGPAKRDTVWAQLYHAKMADTEAAWQAVLHHFPSPPTDEYYHHLARQGLAYCYLNRMRDYEKALGPLRELASLGEAWPGFQAFGIAGLVVAHARLGETAIALDEYSRLTSAMLTSLAEQSPQMAELLGQALEQMERTGS
jgi:eukaryotic-like serine/threonine-protein kinase